ncbi:MAG: hypothetical protein K2N71_03555 [Oscillospiraceae bacterium]|nr:hypothetical protein [Oscillospiraceae bacterium]
MKISKVLAAIAATATAVSMVAVSASATNWANASYADDDPNTVKVISVDDNKASFTATADGQAAKLRITVGELLEEADVANVKSATWTVTYEIPEGTAAGNGVGGGTYFGIKNSTGYWISPDYDDDGNSYWGSGTYTAADEAKFLLPTEVLSADSELVFMDWSNHEAITAMTVSISDLKFFDGDGNEIAQKAFAGAASAPAAETTEAAPAADNGAATTSATTGNAAVASIAAVMAVAGVAAIAAKKRK